MNVHHISILRPILSRIRPKQSALFAILRKDIDLLSEICSRKGVFEEESHRGQALLQIAVLFSRKDVTKTLLEFGANPDIRDRNGWTPLHLAVDLGVVSTLLEQGADVQAKDADHNTPLHLHARFAHAEIVQFLISKGADPNIENRSGQTPLHDACSSGAELGQTSFFSDVGMNFGGAEDPCGLSGLEMESLRARSGLTPSRREIEPVHTLINSGSNVNHPDENGITPIHLAADTGWVEAIKTLLDQGADPNSRTVRPVTTNRISSTPVGSTPLHMVASFSLDCVRLLVAGGADVLARTDNGVSILHRAIGSMSESDMTLETIKFLLSRGADANVQDSEGNTPLHLATNRKWERTTSELLATDPDLSLRNDRGRSVQDAVDHFRRFPDRQS